MKNKGLIITLCAILGVALIFGIMCISTYNGLVSEEESLNELKGNVQSTLQRRNDLIPNLVSTVKGYAAHEQEVYTAIADARAALSGATASGDIEQMQNANAQLDSALSRLLVVVENYPELKANQNFIQLQDELAGTENRINVARIKYNEGVKTYNKKVRSFPSNIFAGMFGFETAQSFEASESAQQAPSISFD
ncbi:MAG: LemA family protein [Clostridia bacterium]|nr:LemA family protein [Clostridia bacterium]